jgi:hypothetical protein
MRGCLSLPFRLLFLVILLLGGYVAWLHRREIMDRVHHWTARPGSSDSVVVGKASGAQAAHRKLAALSGGSDSILLEPRELADLLAAAAGQFVPGALDSIQVRLERDAVELQARLDTRRVPLSFGPLSGIIRDHENIEAGGELLFRHAGLAEWRITSARVRGVPLPRDVLGRLLGRFGGSDNSVVPVPLPPSVGGLRIAPAGLVLYGRAPGTRP